MKLKNIFTVLIALCVPAVAFAQAAAVAVPAQSAVVVFLTYLFGKLPTSFPSWIAPVLAALFEIIVRIWPTAKPQSIFIWIASLFDALSAGFKKISGLLDSLVQNIAPPSA